MVLDAIGGKAHHPDMSKARLLRDRKISLQDGAVLQFRVWEVAVPVPPSGHRLKYSLYYGKGGVRLVGYDNERGKGDHKHVAGVETPYGFTDLETLFNDFFADVEAMRGEPL